MEKWSRHTDKKILEIAKDIVNYTGFQLAGANIPNVYEYEENTDPATLELREAIIRYIDRMYNERAPYIHRSVKVAMTSLAKRKRPGAKGLVRNPNGRKGKAAAI